MTYVKILWFGPEDSEALTWCSIRRRTVRVYWINTQPLFDTAPNNLDHFTTSLLFLLFAQIQMKELKPDILRLIVDQAVGDINTKEPKEKAKQQELLAKFMQVKVSRRIQLLHTTTHQEVSQSDVTVYCTSARQSCVFAEYQALYAISDPCSTDTARLEIQSVSSTRPPPLTSRI
jgi:hypothetical protein